MTLFDTLKTFVADDEPFELGLTVKGGKELLRALAIAQAVEEAAIASDSTVEFIMRRADELLKEKP